VPFRPNTKEAHVPRFAANLTLMFNEWPFLDRFDAAAEAGFAAVEYLFPYDHPPEAIAERLARTGLIRAAEAADIVTELRLGHGQSLQVSVELVLQLVPGLAPKASRIAPHRGRAFSDMLRGAAQLRSVALAV